ncbi:uncharacterized protein LY89DRAFT_117800 [Mollisia scopiformis]|uniref:Uncharacterized protein n=1 Tax=Mollisia scopiformis TaxID=149040 RepID=A0A194X349_MOLSC|nr:uncharacterized protein LY89DRAFT_117800 [Mollisia scopiformis]KUJ14625.1 hypothetical protein LY89DRAFT_117800 [Mollisia scopiformis]
MQYGNTANSRRCTTLVLTLCSTTRSIPHSLLLRAAVARTRRHQRLAATRSLLWSDTGMRACRLCQEKVSGRLWSSTASILRQPCDQKFLSTKGQHTRDTLTIRLSSPKGAREREQTKPKPQPATDRPFFGLGILPTLFKTTHPHSSSSFMHIRSHPDAFVPSLCCMSQFSRSRFDSPYERRIVNSIRATLVLFSSIEHLIGLQSSSLH